MPKYNDSDTVVRGPKLHNKEPYFIIRGKDALAVPAIEYYRDEYYKRYFANDETGQDFLESLEEMLLIVEQWQEENEELVEVPD